eukprot:Hpha_TRINITY_DN14821_c0_g1::TRINITY_DN14821_c0_g1_i1::g.170388::m.170388/K01673/cynT, can; carbonic anhydrase
MPTETVQAVEAANKAYAESFTKGDLALPPARGFAVLTCMDARLDPAKFAGLSEGDAHVIRNAGGRASDDAIRSLVISSKLLGTKEFFVIHHTDCGMELFDSQIMGGLVSRSLKPATFDGKEWTVPEDETGVQDGKYINWLTFKGLADSVVEDVKRIRSSPLVPKYIPAYGYIYDVKNGRLIEVEAATAAGKASN